MALDRVFFACARFYGSAMSDFVLRAATPADAPVIVALLAELAAYEKLQDRFALSEEAVRRDMLGTACHCDLAFAGSEAAGIATWFWTYKSFGAARGLYVEDLYVKPHYRGQGLGRQLLACLAGRARQANGFLEWRVLDWNAPAIAFYESLGARLVPEWVDCRLEGEDLKRLAP
jgi:GNAT superfamily N-acetyltransferase